MTELSEQLKHYFVSHTGSYYKTYRNRARLSEFDYMVPVLQPDIVVTGTNDTALYRAMCMTYDSYPNGWSQYIRDVFTHATEATPSYLLINIYGQQDHQAVIKNILQRLAITGELEEDEPFIDSKLEGLLILSPTHFVKLYYYKNVFVLFTNTLQRELLYKLNTAIFHIRTEVTKDFMAPDISEIMSDFQNICDDYVERMCTQTIYSEFGEVYTKLYDLKTSMAEILAAKKAMETMQSLVAELHNPLCALEKADKERTKNNIENRITDLERQLATLYAKLKNCNLYLAGLLKGSEALDESIKQFQALLKEDMQSGELTNMKVAVPHKGWTDELDSTDVIDSLGFQMASVFKFWNTDEARMYIDNTSSCLYDHSKLAQELFEKIFIDKTVKMKVFMQFYLQKQYGEITSWNPPHKTMDLFPFSNKKGCKHPHIMRFDCWGDNAAPILQALEEQDYATVYLMCKQVLYSIAMADGAVVDALLDAIDNCSDVTDAKWYIYKDKEYSGKELEFVLAKERAEAEKEVKENEDSENDGSN